MLNLLISLFFLLPPPTNNMEALSLEEFEKEYTQDELALSLSCGVDKNGLPLELEMEKDEKEPLECDCPKGSMKIFVSKEHKQVSSDEVDFSFVIDFLEDKDLIITEHNVYSKGNQSHFIFRSLNDKEEVLIWRYTKS